jgi:hypothetical protein
VQEENGSTGMVPQQEDKIQTRKIGKHKPPVFQKGTVGQTAVVPPRHSESHYQL